MEIKQEIFFYKLVVQVDEGHYEELFFSMGKPPKDIEEVQKEAEDDFYFALSEFKKANLNDILHQKLAQYGYQPLEIEDSIYYPEPNLISEDYAKKQIEAREGDDYYDEEFKERLNSIRIQRGKDPFPISTKNLYERPKKSIPNTTLERPNSSPLDEVENFETFLENLRKQEHES